jgi:asparagine synthase (glutamine-hydrolysing)
MSVQFGRWNFDSQPVGPGQTERISKIFAAYGPDSNEIYSKGDVEILYRAFHTTKESRREVQPHISPSGPVITWDGRLDNRSELIGELRNVSSINSTDVEIVSAAFERWGDNCLKRLIGDWALSIWNPNTRSVLLAKDPIGTRHLYYSIDKDCLTWSSTLDPLVLFADRKFELCEEYIAGWFSNYPATYLTPYVGIHSVPPSSSVFVRRGKHIISKYWDFDPAKRIRYRTDGEYEEHFRSVFAKAVQRKLRSDAPVLSELSGGRDSSSIVCMADTIIARGAAECPRLDTISYYDDSEPNWNERPYFTKVEEKRGRTGWHVGPDSEVGAELEPTKDRHVPAPNYPGYDGRTSRQIGACLAANGNRVLLSGVGGDEVMGGVPTSAPELQDLIASGRIRALAHQLKVWALEKRKPWFHLFWEAARDFFPIWLLGVPKEMRSAPWLQRRFVNRNRAALIGYVSRTKLSGALPSLQANLSALDVLRRQLAQVAPPFEPPFEKRFPYLDRDLLEFMFAVPREQLVRPAQRRSLMRRALAGIVPDEILNRKTKAFVARAPLVRISNEWATLTEMTQHMISSSLGIVDSARFSEVLLKARRGEDEVPIVTLMRTLFVEGWIKTLDTRGIVNLGKDRNPQFAWQASTQG